MKTPHITNPKTCREYVRALPPWERHLIRYTKESENERGLCLTLIDEAAKIFIVSDGGYANSIGSYGWVVATETETLWEGA